MKRLAFILLVPALAAADSDFPEPKAAELVLQWNKKDRVRVKLPVDNWSGKATEWNNGFSFNPTVWKANIDLEIGLTCGGACDQLAKNIPSKARRDFAGMREGKRRPKWVVQPRVDKNGVWHWRFTATGRTRGDVHHRVGIERVLPDVGAILVCHGTVSRDKPVKWIDHMETLCREMTVEVIDAR